MHAFAFLLLGIDSLIAATAIGPLVRGRSRYALATWFGSARWVRTRPRTAGMLAGGGLLAGSAAAHLTRRS